MPHQVSILHRSRCRDRDLWPLGAVIDTPLRLAPFVNEIRGGVA